MQATETGPVVNLCLHLRRLRSALSQARHGRVESEPSPSVQVAPIESHGMSPVAALAAEDRVRAFGVAAQSLTQTITYDLMMVGGTLELVQEWAELPAPLRESVQTSTARLADIAARVQRLHSIVSEPVDATDRTGLADG